MRRLTALVLAAALAALVAPAAAFGSFGFLPGAEGFSAAATKPGGTDATAAGTHPYAFEASVGLATEGAESDGDLRDLRISLPPGFLVNPTVVSECGETAFHTPRSTTKPGSLSGENCSRSSQVGVVKVRVGGTTRHFGLFNLVPPFGAPAAIGASPYGTPLVFVAQMRDGDVGLDLQLENLPQNFDLQSLTLTVWGTPWWGDNRPAETHDPQRGNCLDEETGGSLASTCQVLAPGVFVPESQTKSFLTLPATQCGTDLGYTASAVSWVGENAEATATTPPLGSCKQEFVTVRANPSTSAAGAQSGLEFDIDVNDGGGILNPGGIARPPIKTAVASLPEGLTINPSLGAGLGTCGEADFARETADSEPGTGCPDSSKIGTVTVDGALGLAEPLTGSVYVGEPYANPFGALVSLYMVARSPRRGLVVKSQGKIEPDLRSGKLVATFDQLPRLLYTDFTLRLRDGQRSPLLSPPSCGTYSSALSLSTWAEPTVFRPYSSKFFIDQSAEGGPCPSGGIPPFAPGLIAGSLNPAAGAYTPFYLRMTRGDAEQEITSYSATFPPGLLGRLAGVGACPDAAIAAAAARSGTQERAAPSCPASSAIGRTMVGYGVGRTLAWAPGSLYLAGPYNGAPLSVVAINSALVGPFDLGTVVVRQAVRIDRRTARVSLDAAGSDPIPHVLAGFPLHLRDIRVYVDRPGFMVNPTSCDPMQVTSWLGGAGADPFSGGDDSLVATNRRYQVIDCSGIGFRPRLSLRLHGSAKHSGYPSLRAFYRARPGTANLAGVRVTLPPSLFLAQEHIDTVCTRVQFEADACPAGSVYGYARAFTPLLDEPLQGRVYLRSSRTAVPDLVADLRGRGIRIEVPARIDSKRGGIRATYEFLPDAPVKAFAMRLFGGKRGLLSNAENMCRGIHRAQARFTAHSNATRVLKPHMKSKCGKNKSKKRSGSAR